MEVETEPTRLGQHLEMDRQILVAVVVAKGEVLEHSQAGLEERAVLGWSSLNTLTPFQFPTLVVA